MIDQRCRPKGKKKKKKFIGCVRINDMSHWTHNFQAQNSFYCFVRVLYPQSIVRYDNGVSDPMKGGIERLLRCDNVLRPNEWVLDLSKLRAANWNMWRFDDALKSVQNEDRCPRHNKYNTTTTTHPVVADVQNWQNCGVVLLENTVKWRKKMMISSKWL